MRIKAGHVFLTVLLAFTTPAGIYCIQAQDASYPLQETYDSETEYEGDKVIYSPGEGDPLLNNKFRVPSIRDSSFARPVRSAKTQADAPKNSAKPASQEDDSILSFNFLYYIFEKYKMQDMVD